MKEIKRVYLTKYIFSDKAITACDAEIYEVPFSGSVARSKHFLHHFREGEFHLSLDEAMKKAEEMRIKKLQSLDKQIKKISSMEFKVKELKK